MYPIIPSHPVPTQPQQTEKSQLLQPTPITSQNPKTSSRITQSTRTHLSQCDSKILSAGCLTGATLGCLVSCFFQIPCGIQVAETIAGCAGFGTCISGGCSVCCHPTSSETNATPANRC